MQDQTPFPEFNGKRVYVAGVPDQYKGLAGQIAELEKSSKQTYYVAVVQSSGPGQLSAADYVKAMFATWQRQAQSRGLALDPERSVVVLVALARQKVAVLPGTTLRDLGLDADTVHSELVGPGSTFVKLAKAERYPEAIAALLNETDRWIRARDVTATKTVEIKTPSSPPVSSALPDAVRPGLGTLTVNGPQESSVRLAAIGIGVGLLTIILGVAVLFWLVHQRARSRVARRIKEVRSNATDLMDRLDALKERLKLLPATDPDFQAPMDGETLELYNAVQATRGQTLGSLAPGHGHARQGGEIDQCHLLAVPSEEAARRRVAPGSEGFVRGDRDAIPGLRPGHGPAQSGA